MGLPTEKVLAKLPRRLLVAYAARCAKRAFPIAEHFLETNDIRAVQDAIGIAVGYATAHVADSARVAAHAADSARVAAHAAHAADSVAAHAADFAAAHAARAAAHSAHAVRVATHAAARDAAYAAGHADAAYAAAYAAGHADAATQAAASAAAEADYHQLLKFSETSDYLSVDLPLWPNGEPEWYTELVAENAAKREAAEKQDPKEESGEAENNEYQDTPSLELLIDPGTATAEDLADLYYEISKLYRMMGGPGIDFRVTDVREPSFEEAV